MTNVPSERDRHEPAVNLTAIGGVGARFVADVAQALRADTPIYLIIAGYAAFALALGGWLGVGQRVDVFAYLPVWLMSVAVGALLYVLLIEIPLAIRTDSRSPLAALSRRLARLWTPTTLTKVAMVVALGVFMGAFTSVKTMLPFLVDFAWDEPLASLDAAIHGGVDPWRLLHPMMSPPAVNQAVQFTYVGVWLTVTCGAAAGAACAGPGWAHRRRYLMTFLLAWILLGNVLAGIFYSAGPAYYQAVAGGARFADLVAYHAAQPQTVTSAHVLQHWLWDQHEAGLMQIGTGISAFPSMHVSMATLVALAAFSLDRALGWVALAYLAVVLATSVHLGWHYAADGYVSILATIAIWRALRPRTPAAAR